MTDFDVIVLGGGIAGLSAAHELRRRGYTGRVLVLERNEGIGGQARSWTANQQNISDEKAQDTHFWTEYSWRVYGPSYHTIRRIQREIPYIPINTDGSAPAPVEAETNTTVHDQLVNIRNNILALNDSSTVVLNYGTSAFKSYLKEFNNVGWKDKLSLINKACTLLITSDPRMREEISNIRWKDYIPNVPKFQDFLVRSMAAYLGVDYRHASVSAVWDVAEGAMRGGGDLSVFNGPTSEVFFKPWQRHLQSQDVIVKPSSPVVSITKSNNEWEAKTATDVYKTKWIISALPTEELARLIPKPEFKQLSDLSRQWMVAIQFYFLEDTDPSVEIPPRGILKPEAATAIHLPESAWQLIIEPQGLIWDKRYLTGAIKDIWSVGICDDLTPGLLVKKAARYCTQEEMFQECWYQITQTSVCQDRGIPRCGIPSYKPLNQYKPNFGYLWYSFQWDPERKETLTWEPKFSPNAGTWKLRPETEKFIHNNLLIAGVYSKNPEEIATMDAAAQSGVRAAISLLNREMEEKSNTGKPINYFLQQTEPQPTRAWPWLLAPLRGMDGVLYDIGLPSLPGLPTLILYFILLVVIVWYILKQFL